MRSKCCLSVQTVEDEQLQAGRETLRLLTPVGHQAGGRDHQAGAVHASALASGAAKMRQRLCIRPVCRAPCRLGENSRERSLFAQKLQPVQPALLIAAQFGAQDWRRRPPPWAGCRRIGAAFLLSSLKSFPPSQRHSALPLAMLDNSAARNFESRSRPPRSSAFGSNSYPAAASSIFFHAPHGGTAAAARSGN